MPKGEGLDSQFEIAFACGSAIQTMIYKVMTCVLFENIDLCDNIH